MISDLGEANTGEMQVHQALNIYPLPATPTSWYFLHSRQQCRETPGPTKRRETFPASSFVNAS